MKITNITLLILANASNLLKNHQPRVCGYGVYKQGFASLWECQYP